MLPSLVTYKGPWLPARVIALLKALQNCGLTVATSGRANKTLRVQRGTTYLGYVNEFVIKRNGLIGYRFQLSPEKGNNACPDNFDLSRFAEDHGFPVTAFDIQPDDEKRFLHILEPDVALALFREGSSTASADGVAILLGVSVLGWASVAQASQRGTVAARVDAVAVE